MIDYRILQREWHEIDGGAIGQVETGNLSTVLTCGYISWESLGIARGNCKFVVFTQRPWVIVDPINTNKHNPPPRVLLSPHTTFIAGLKKTKTTTQFPYDEARIYPRDPSSQTNQKYS
jgi:hypothetical protein